MQLEFSVNAVFVGKPDLIADGFGQFRFDVGEDRAHADPFVFKNGAATLAVLICSFESTTRTPEEILLRIRSSEARACSACSL